MEDQRLTRERAEAMPRSQRRKLSKLAGIKIQGSTKPLVNQVKRLKKAMRVRI